MSGMSAEVGRVVSYKETPSYSECYVILSPGQKARPGELLLVEVEEGRHYVIGRVEEGMEMNLYESPELARTRSLLGIESVSNREDLPNKYRLVRLDLLEEVVGGTQVKPTIREIQTLVSAGSRVFRAPSDWAAPALGLLPPNGGAGGDGMYIGTTVGEASIPVILSANAVLPRHVLIVGSTGTGKSWLRGVIAEEVRKLGIPQVNIDVHGEFVKAAVELGGENLVPGQSLTVPLSSLSEPEVIGLIPYLTELQGEIVRRAFLNLKKRGKPFDVPDFVNEVRSVGIELNARDQTIEIAADRVEALNSIRIIGNGINWSHKLSTRKFVNIDCRGLSHSELQAVAGAVARELLNLRMRSEIPPVVFSIDEAHLFVPYSTFGEETTSSQIIREVIRFGRHYGVCLILVTPAPSDIDRRIARITNTRFIFATEPDQLDYLKGVFADTPEDIIKRLPKLEQGVCLLTGSRETVRHALLIRVRGRKTTHGGETPNIIEEVKRFEKSDKNVKPKPGGIDSFLKGGT
jgi:DNA helicase HerA-like ATPase